MAVGPPTRRQLQAAATQEQLLGAARDVFEVRGYAATTVGAITSAANTAHGTFYLYFRNKEDAFANVMAAVACELYEQAGTRWQQGDAYDAIEARIRGFLEVFLAHRGLWRCLLEGSFANPAIEAMWLEIRQRFIDRIERNLRELAEGGEIRPLHPRLTANALGAMVEWAATTQFVLHPTRSPGILRGLRDHLGRALVPRRAPRPEGAADRREPLTSTLRRWARDAGRAGAGVDAMSVPTAS